MSIIGLIILLVVCGVGLYLLNTLVPLDPKFRTAINAVVGIVLFIYLLYWLSGFFGWDLGAPPHYAGARRGC